MQYAEIVFSLLNEKKENINSITKLFEKDFAILNFGNRIATIKEDCLIKLDLEARACR